MSAIEKVQKDFENWFINMHGDVDESLIERKTEDGRQYMDTVTNEAWFCFKAGYSHGYLEDV